VVRHAGAALRQLYLSHLETGARDASHPGQMLAIDVMPDVVRQDRPACMGVG
jgi:hypothetical protein